MRKQMMVVLMALAVVTSGSGMALAYPGERQAPCMWDCPQEMGCPGMMMGRGMGMGPGNRMPPLPPEKQKAYQEIVKTFSPRFSALHDQFVVKRMELNALSRNPNTSPELISRTASELSTIMAAMRKEQSAFRERFEKEIGPFPPMKGPRHGRPGRGPGHPGRGPAPAGR